jgi:hypothetical protein
VPLPQQNSWNFNQRLQFLISSVPIPPNIATTMSQRFSQIVEKGTAMLGTSVNTTAITAGIIGLLALVFQGSIISLRSSDKILIGSGGNKDLEMMSRG